MHWHDIIFTIAAFVAVVIFIVRCRLCVDLTIAASVVMHICIVCRRPIIDFIIATFTTRCRLSVDVILASFMSRRRIVVMLDDIGVMPQTIVNRVTTVGLVVRIASCLFDIERFINILASGICMAILLDIGLAHIAIGIYITITRWPCR